MRIKIDTHNTSKEELQPLLDYLQENNWDYRFVNKDEPEYGMPDTEVNDCQHNYVNGMCTKCYWLEV